MMVKVKICEGHEARRACSGLGPLERAPVDYN